MLYRIALTFAGLVVLLGLSCGGDAPAPAPTATAQPAPQPTQPPAQPSGPPAGDVVRVENQDIGGSGEYKFVPEEFNFKVGETITFSYTFDRAGRFEITCIPHQAFGMTGLIVVE